MTMANAAVTSPARTGVSLRKTNKPLMEKRRRARINDSLTQLKSLVIQGSKKDSSQFNKLEKADILELTVKHLRNLQAQQQQQAHISQAGNNDPSLAGKYQAGFMECANEVIRYLGQSQGFSDDIKARVISHLASCIQLSSKSSFSKPIQPNTMAPSNTSIMAAGQQATSTAQLANGQIIQIVNSPYQTVKPSSMNQFPVGQTVQIAPALPSTLAASSASSHISAAARSTSAVTNSTSTSSPEPAQYIRYTQPLHIQIPPVLSPILIQPQPQSQSQQPKPVQTQVMATRVRDLEPQVVAHLPTPPQEAAISSSSTSPQSQDRCQSPPPHRPIQRLHPAYIQDDLNSDLLPRTRTYSMASSSSSSESELVSPLNLSQSPQYYDSRKEDFTNKYSSHDSRQLSRGCPQYEKLSPSQPMYRDSLVSSHFHSSNCTSVIVDGRKTLDSHALKYMHMMMDDDRHCMPHEGSTSPASSVGEERLWRPW